MGRAQSIPYVAMEFATVSLRAEEGCFHIARNRNLRPPGARSNIATLLRGILRGNSFADLHAALSENIHGLYSWAQVSSKLRASVFKNFADPGRDMVILANYANGDSTPFPGTQNGPNFENCFYIVDASGDGGGEMRCGRERKPP